MTGGPYFLGDDLNIIDCMFAPFLERMAASLAYYKGFFIRGPQSSYPAIDRWFKVGERGGVGGGHAGLLSDGYH